MTMFRCSMDADSTTGGASQKTIEEKEKCYPSVNHSWNTSGRRRLEAAAYDHATPREEHRGTGSDPFKWVLCITIGYACFTNERFKEAHGITTPTQALKEWIIEHGELETHDGDFDTLAMIGGIYNEYVKPQPGELLN